MEAAGDADETPVLSLIGFGGFAVTSLVIGARLALLARRTRQLPEAAMAVAFLGAGALGNTLGVLAALGVGGEAAHAPLQAVARIAGVAGAAALYGFTWRVFRSGSRIAMGVFATGVGLQLYTWIGHALVYGVGADLTSLAWWWPLIVSRSFPYLWAGAEAVVYWRKMRLRQGLGLADAATTQRFLLWALGASAAFLIFVINMARTAITGELGPSQLTRDAASLLGIVAAVFVWLAFFPPAAFTRWAARRGATPAS
jgi:hypothetical protein